MHRGFHAGWCFAVVHVPWGNYASPSPPSHEEGVALLLARTCNEVVPAHKEFLRTRQTPVPLTCIVCWVLACTVPDTRYAAPGTRREYLERVLVSYNTTAAVHIYTTPFSFSISKASPAGLCSSLAQTHQKLGGKAIYFFWRKASKFLETYFRTLLIACYIRPHILCDHLPGIYLAILACLRNAVMHMYACCHWCSTYVFRMPLKTCLVNACGHTRCKLRKWFWVDIFFSHGIIEDV